MTGVAVVESSGSRRAGIATTAPLKSKDDFIPVRPGKKSAPMKVVLKFASVDPRESRGGNSMFAGMTWKTEQD